jgi:hypothetical protein
MEVKAAVGRFDGGGPDERELDADDSPIRVYR